MGVPVAHRDEKAHRRLLAGLLNLLESQRPIIYDDIDVSTGSLTSAPFEDVPSWVQKITISLNGVSTSSTGNLRVQFKVGGSWDTTNYASDSFRVNGTEIGAGATAGIIVYNNGASHTWSGPIVLTKMQGDDWVAMSVLAREDAGANIISGGIARMTGQIEGIRVTMTTGNFDAGSVGCRAER